MRQQVAKLYNHGMRGFTLGEKAKKMHIFRTVSNGKQW